MSASTIATITISTKRRPSVSSGKVGEPTTYLSDLKAVPLLPINPEMVNTDVLQSPREAKETFVFADANNDLPDIEEGDIVVMASTEYIVRTVAEWNRQTSGAFLHLVIEEQKQ